MSDISLEKPPRNPITMSKLDHALAIAAKGLPVFPLQHTNPDGSCTCGDDGCRSQGKHPLAGSHGWKDATVDAAQIRKWWAANPDANIAIHPGKEFVYFDLDKKNEKNGIRELANYLDMSEANLLAMTYCVETASGAFHLYFKADKPYGNRTSMLPGVDVRADGGHVVAEGSTIYKLNDEFDYFERPYKVRSDVPVAMLPDSLAGLLRESMQRSEKAGVTWDPLLTDLPHEI